MTSQSQLLTLAIAAFVAGVVYEWLIKKMVTA